jgi:SAM-dependent methyltransferase
LFDDLIAEYKNLEPEDADSWNPLTDDKELWHRIRLFVALKWALRQIPIPASKIKILDVGCGVGRSTRALIELGVRPNNIVGIDLRASAIEYAKALNPGINFYVVESFSDWPHPETFDLCMQCTVFSSIKGNERRLLLARKMEEIVSDGGYIFWWDRIHANTFAGSDLLDLQKMFRQSSLLYKYSVSLQPSIQEALRTNVNSLSFLFRTIQKKWGYRHSHLMALFRKIS